MLCIIRRAKLFHQVSTSEAITKDAAGNEVQAEVQQRFFASPSNIPQSIPDWCKRTLTYKVGLVDKSIIDVTPAPAALPNEVTEAAPGSVKPPTDSKPADQPAPADTGLTDNGSQDDGAKANGKKKS